MFVISAFWWFLTLLGCVICAVIPDLFRLDIVHYNDFHARFEETAMSVPVCASNDSSCMGGFSRLYYAINHLMREKPGSLLLNAGDAFQGTYWYTFLKWNVTQKFINLLPNDAHALGNHEFDDGINGLVPYLNYLKAPVVAANVNLSKEPQLQGLIQPSIVIKKKGRKIGIIGLITPRTSVSSNTENVIFLDPIETTRKEAKILTNYGVDIIIVLSHCGLDVDKVIAQDVGRNIDVIIGGHTHSLLWNSPVSPSNDTISGPYPVIVEKNNHKVLIATASAFTKYLGNLTLYFDKNGELQHFDGEPVFLNRSIPEDPEINNLLQPYKDMLHLETDMYVGKAEDNFNMNVCNFGECALGNLIVDSYYDKVQKVLTSEKPTVVFLINNMRSSINRGNITRGVLTNTLPFSNEIAAFDLQGEYLLESMNYCLSKYRNLWQTKSYASPWIPQVAGMKLTLNTTDSKVQSILIKDGNNWKALKETEMYKVVTSKFYLQGKSGFKMFKDHGRNAEIIGIDRNILEEFVAIKSPVTPILENRVMLVE